MASSPSVPATWSEALQLLRRQRVLFLPLGISAALKTALLGLSLLAPFPPLARFLAPMVRYFWGEVYLHYPYHLALASRWFKRADLLVPVFLEGLLMGITAVLTRHLLLKNSYKFRQAFADTFRRYPALILLTVIDLLVIMVCIQASLIPVKLLLQRVKPALWSQTYLLPAFVVALTATVVSAAIESFFIFSIPSCVVENRSWLKSLWFSFRTAVRAYRWVFFSVLAVSLGYLPVLLIRYGSVRLVESPWPESVLLVYLGRILFSWFFGTVFTVWATTYVVRLAEARSRGTGSSR